MKLFELKNWQLSVSEETWGLSPFKTLLDRDKSKEKEVALAELMYIYHFCDIRSDYNSMSEENRKKELRKDISGLPKNWKVDKSVQIAIDFYNSHETIIQRLYKQTSKAAGDVGDYLENTRELLDERDLQGKIVTDINKITQSIQRIPKLMADLKSAYKEVVKEQEDLNNKKKGSKSFNTFEDGL